MQAGALAAQRDDVLLFSFVGGSVNGSSMSLRMMALTAVFGAPSARAQHGGRVDVGEGLACERAHIPTRGERTPHVSQA